MPNPFSVAFEGHFAHAISRPFRANHFIGCFPGLKPWAYLWAGLRSAGHHGNLRDEGGATFVLVIAALSVEGYERKGNRTGSALCSDRTDGYAAGQ